MNVLILNGNDEPPPLGRHVREHIERIPWWVRPILKFHCLLGIHVERYASNDTTFFADCILCGHRYRTSLEIE